MKNKKLREHIHEGLLHNVYLRDSDHKLVAWVWREEIKEHWGDDIINLLNMDKLTNWESISRCRRLLQAENEELRGDNWKERHEKSVEVAMELMDYKPEL